MRIAARPFAATRRLNTTAGETCDDGGESATCDADCSAASCGDGTTNTTAGEACDDSGQSATCDADCSAATCGDATLNTVGGRDLRRRR